MAIKNIIFDLGGVLLDIDFNKTREAFEGYGFDNFNDYYQQSYSSPVFSSLEQGLISPAEFCEGVRKMAGVNMNDAQIEKAWNALLLGFRRNSIAYVNELKNKYNLYLLSNTNAMHYEAFLDMYDKEFGDGDFDDHFHQTYYSHLIQLVKPGPASYLYITNQHNLLPAETLFVDDTLKNIEGAMAVGLQTLHLQKGMLIEDVLPAILAGE